MSECQLCGDDSRMVTATDQPALPKTVQDRFDLCGGCYRAVKEAEDGECAWCGKDNTATVYAVYSGRRADERIGELCISCTSD